MFQDVFWTTGQGLGVFYRILVPNLRFVLFRVQDSRKTSQGVGFVLVEFWEMFVITCQGFGFVLFWVNDFMDNESGFRVCSFF